MNNCDLITEASPERRFAVFLGVTFDDNPDLVWDFRGNWWGTTNPDEIAELIMDGNDDPRIDEFVDFSDWLQQPVPVQGSTFGGLKSRFRQNE